MKRYEGLFILNTSGKEEGVKETIDKIVAEMSSLGVRIDAIQKMEKRPFSRVANKKISSGYYANILFEAEPAAIEQLHTRFALSPDVFRVIFTQRGVTPPAAAAPVAA